MKYLNLKSAMDSYYSQNCNNPVIKEMKLEKDKICVASDNNRKSFYRVQIAKFDHEKATCLFVDDGTERVVRTANLFKIEDKFLSLKFQVFV